jgi:hypothetical protein
MANIYVSESKLWECDTAGLLTANKVMVAEVIYIPLAVDNDLVIQDGNDKDFVVLKAGNSDKSPIRWENPNSTKKVSGLKIATIDGGIAYIRLK